MRNTERVPEIDILGDDFAHAAMEAGLRARLHALAAGHTAVYLDDLDRCVEELPDGRRFEVELQPGAPRDSHIPIIRELPASLGDASRTVRNCGPEWLRQEHSDFVHLVRG
jgi:hypothetical protein